MARPTGYNTKIADKICTKLMTGQSLRSICRDERMPALSTVFRWLTLHPEFSDQYARAREVQADTLFDDVLEIADDSRNDWMEQNGDEAVGYKLNGEHVQRARLRIDTRKWMAGKLRPKKYGEKYIVGGDDDLDAIKTKETGGGAEKVLSFLNTIAERSGTAGDPDA